jgi:DNA-binding transcriptional LysR family regulator
MTNSFFTSVVRDFQRQYAGVALSFADMVPSAILDSVANRTADVGFLRGVFPKDGLAVEDLDSEPLIVALPNSHPLVQKKMLTGADLADEPFVMVPDEGSMGYNDVVRAYCRDNGFSPKLRAEGNQMQSVVWLVNLGLGLSLVPASLQGLHRDNVAYRELREAPSITAKLVYRRNDPSPVLRNFVDLVVASVARSAKRS